MRLKDKIILFLLAFSAIAILFYFSRQIIAPFVIAIIIAYFLNPIVCKLHGKFKISRLSSTSLIISLFFSVLISIFLVIFPIIYSQFIDFITLLPSYLNKIYQNFYPAFSEILTRFEIDLKSDLASNKKEITAKIFSISQDIISSFFTSSSLIIDVFSIILIMPILLFYFLKDWLKIVDKVDQLLPKKYRTDIRKIFSDIDSTMSGYIRGQFNVCLILGLIYAILLSFAGLNFGFLIGFFTGLLVFIPYIGMLIGVVLAIIIALFQWGIDFFHIGIISAIFILGQIIESNFLTPKLVGSKIGLHPVWLIFGLFFFGINFGFIGILFAVPLSAIFAIIFKYFVAQYKRKFVN